MRLNHHIRWPRAANVAFATVMNVALATAIVACQSGDQDSQVAKRTPIVAPLVWLSNGTILFSRVDRLGEGDAFQITCDSGGIFALDQRGNVENVNSSEITCNVLGSLATVSYDTSENRLLYANPREGGRLEALWLSTGVVRFLATGCEARDGPTWSPNGDAFAFVGRCRELGQVELFVADASGSTPIRVPLPRGRGEPWYPRWSPDGARIAVGLGDIGTGGDLIVVNIGSGTFEVVGRSGLLPSWAPGGDQLAYVLDRFGRPDQVQTVRVAKIERDAPPLAANKSVGDGQFTSITSVPIWSPNGRNIVLASDGFLWLTDSLGVALRVVWPLPKQH